MTQFMNANPLATRRETATNVPKTRTVCVQGLGFVGAANAVAIASARTASGRPLYEVIGVDLDNDIGRERAASINEGRFPFPTIDQNLIRATKTARTTGNLSAVTDPTALAEADIIVVNVGLDIERKRERPVLRLSPFHTALSTVGSHMRADTLVLVESTVPPGACERIVAPILREHLSARALPDEPLLLAYCYERVTPGDRYLASITEMCRVYSGLTPEAADAAEQFLSSYIDVSKNSLYRLPNIRSAETAKILENTYRAVNIALIDEWERFARRIDVNLFDVLEAIRMRPTHNNIRSPGLGVGGYCLTKDPAFGAASAHEIYGFDDLQFPLSTTSIQINDAMPLASVDALESLLPAGLKDKRILVLGASYRPDVGDTRSSPSGLLANALLEGGAHVEVADPLIDSFDEVAVPLHRELPEARAFDVVVMAVAHREYLGLDIVNWAGDARPLIFDANGVLSTEKISALREAGFRVAAIGRGEST
jgi:nucleotide sugar dehydrogenase